MKFEKLAIKIRGSLEESFSEILNPKLVMKIPMMETFWTWSENPNKWDPGSQTAMERVFCDWDTKTYYENPRKRSLILYKKTTNDWDLGYNFEGNEIIREWDPKPVFQNTEMKFFKEFSTKKRRRIGIEIGEENPKIIKLWN